MTGTPAVDSRASMGLLGVLKAWLQARSGEIWPLSEASPGEAELPNDHRFGSARVLVVDDNPVNLMVISAQLESLGLVPLLATDGDVAVALACERRFDLILMDLQMPVLDGFDATAAIRRFEAASARPAVPIIAYSSTSPSAAALATHGLDGSLIKPCGEQELVHCLTRWCPTYVPHATVRSIGQVQPGWPPASRASGNDSASAP